MEAQFIGTSGLTMTAVAKRTLWLFVMQPPVFEMETRPEPKANPRGKWPHPLAIFLLGIVVTVVVAILLTKILDWLAG
jgi:hypothetical protein